MSMIIPCASPRRSPSPLSRSMEYMVPLLVGVNCIAVVMFLTIGFARLYPLPSMTSSLRVYLPCGLGSGGCCDLIPTREWWGWWWQRSGSCHHVPLSQRGCRQCHGSHRATRPSPFTANRRLAFSCTMQRTWSMLSSSLVLSNDVGSAIGTRTPFMIAFVHITILTGALVWLRSGYGSERAGKWFAHT